MSKIWFLNKIIKLKFKIIKHFEFKNLIENLSNLINLAIYFQLNLTQCILVKRKLKKD